MDEEQLDSLRPWKPFGTGDAMRIEAKARRSTALGVALWGKTADDLERQLSAPHPEIPSGFDLADFHELARTTQRIAALLAKPQYAWLSNTPAVRVLPSPATGIGPASVTAWQARCEIVRRAIEYLEGR